MIERMSWLLLALVHAIPALATVKPDLIERLYGVSREAAAFPLLQHRAALFLAVFVVCVWSSFDPSARRVAAVVTAISMISFLAIYVLSGFPTALRTIAIADLLAVVPLGYVAWRAFG